MNAVAEVREPFQIDSAHPSLPGHFPGRPVVPGVVLLDRIAAAIEHRGWGRFARIAVVKFVSPLLPEQPAHLAVLRDGSRVRFRIERDGAAVLIGEGELQ